LDSSILIDLLRQRSSHRNAIASFVVSGHVLCVSAINVGEVYAGMREEEELRTAALLAGLDFYPATQAISRRAGLLKNNFARRGQALSLQDMLIAATAIEHDLTLMTDNIKHFPIPELKLHQ
jgi:predicted nucleic acid-binding protein